MFRGLTNLQFLYLNDNHLASLPSHSFRDLALLNLLALQNNNLSAINSATFSGLTSLSTLFLNSNELQTFGNTSSTVTNLVELFAEVVECLLFVRLTLRLQVSEWQQVQRN
eukprot:m.75050 g.75050  ORF g.75050 m.75050 type:complete len:111 (+) comp50375_c0_seq10:992-1324(+)